MLSEHHTNSISYRGVDDIYVNLDFQIKECSSITIGIYSLWRYHPLHEHETLWKLPLFNSLFEKITLQSQVKATRLKGFLWKKVPPMEMWVKSDYLRVFLCLLQPISRPILFPLSLNKQPISLARSHNWLSLSFSNRCALLLCPLWRDSIYLLSP